MSKKLLLADDSITIQKVIQITFAHEDYELTITDNGDSALVKAQDLKPDLVLADVYMPGKNGYELSAAIKQDPSLQHVPVLLLAGSFEPFDEEKARESKADAWIEKPFESQSLIDKVAELLSSVEQTPQTAAPAAVPKQVAVVRQTVDNTTVALEAAAAPAPPETEPMMEDPFGDVSFVEEEVTAAEPEPVAGEDDWSDVATEIETPQTAFGDEFDADESAETDDFSFEEEQVPAGSAGHVPAASVSEDYDVFAMDEDDIMPLDEVDILGEEDLEPVSQEQTLAAWSRDESAVEDVFEEPLADAPLEEIEEADIPAVELEADQEPAVPIFAEPEEIETPEAAGATSDSFVVQEPSVAIAEESSTASAAAMAVVEEKAAGLGEEEIERIIEKVVAGVVEKLAGTIIERVAWEIVPDLAESLIREEIRKIKDAAA